VSDPDTGFSYTLAAGVLAPRIAVMLTPGITPQFTPQAARAPGRVQGVGTAESPLILTNADQLAEIAALVNDGELEAFVFGDYADQIHLTLGADLSLANYGKNSIGFNEGRGWVPIGTLAHPFRGVFDGGGHTIFGLYIGDKERDNAGLFGRVGETRDGAPAVIKSLRLSEVDIAANLYVGGLAAWLAGADIADCRVTGTVKGEKNSKGTRDGNYVGGMFGYILSADITDCFAAVTVHGDYFVGGLAGQSAAELTKSRATGAVSGAGSIGGLVGDVNTGHVEECYATGDVRAERSSAGGLAGRVLYGGTIDRCFATGDVSSGGYGSVGGLAGDVGNGRVTNSYATGTVSGVFCYAGGVAGSVGENNLNNTQAVAWVENCAALNPSAAANWGAGRVTGKKHHDGALSGNIAFSGMTAGAQIIDEENNAEATAAGLCGEGRGLEILRDLTVSGVFPFSVGEGQDTWAYEAGKLPGLFGEAVLMPLHLCAGEAFEGDGTRENPYLIKTAEQLALLAELVNDADAIYGRRGAYYRLENDIDLSAYGVGNPNFNNGEGWIPIGIGGYDDFISGESKTGFKGNFLGNNKTITGLSMYVAESYPGESRNCIGMGLFAYVDGNDGNPVTIENLSVLDVSIDIIGKSIGYAAAGAAGYAEHVNLVNCRVTGRVNCESLAGGVAAYVRYGNLTDCRMTGTVSGVDDIGGVVSYAIEGTSLTACYATGAVRGKHRVGGVAALVSGGTLTNCYATCSVSGEFVVGGVAGDANGILTNCYATGDVTGSQSGGVAGTVVSGILTNCYATGAVSGGYGVGGVAGVFWLSALITNCAALNPSVTAETPEQGYEAGRVVGYIYNQGSAVLSDNIAFSGMKVTISGSDKSGMTANGNGTDGASVDKASLQTAVGFPTGLTSPPWTYTPNNNRLPGFGASLPMPMHLRAKPFDGDGTESDPYLIETEEQPALLAKLVNGENTDYGAAELYNAAHYMLTKDLDLSAYGEGTSFNGGKGWIPIGTQSNPFKGVFNGGGYEIAELFIDNEDLAYAGLFGFILDGDITNCGVTGSVRGFNYVGGVAGSVEGGKIENCYTAGDVTGSGVVVGGVVGNVGNGGSVKACRATGDVTGIRMVGGVVGDVIDSSVTDCYATGAVNSAGDYAGGVAGIVSSGSSMTNCYATGTVRGANDVGGVAAVVSGIITKCYATGAVVGSGPVSHCIGGVAGAVNNFYGSVVDCYATGMVRGYEAVGGVAGEVYNGSLTNCYATGEVSGSSISVGGVAGSVSGSWGVANCVALNRVISAMSSMEDPEYGGGRVAGSSGRNLVNNAAFDAMKVTVNGRERSLIESDATADGIDGRDVTVFDLTVKNGDAVVATAYGFSNPLFWEGGKSADSLDNMGWSSEIWLFEQDRLPVLLGFGGARDIGAQTGDTGLYNSGRKLQFSQMIINADVHVYDGNAHTLRSAGNDPEITVKFGTATLREGLDYRLEYESNINAGTAKVTARGMGDYENYEGVGPGEKSFEIVKADAPAYKHTYFVGAGLSGAYTLDLRPLPVLTAPLSWGGRTYGNPNLAEPSSLPVTGLPAINGSRLAFSVAAAQSGRTAKLRVRVASANFQDFDLLIDIVAIDGPQGKTYDGAPFSYAPVFADAGGKPVPLAAALDYTLTWSGSDAAGRPLAGDNPPTDAGEYRLELAVTSSDYSGGASFPFAIAKKPVRVTGLLASKVYDGSARFSADRIDTNSAVVAPEDVVRSDADGVRLAGMSADVYGLVSDASVAAGKALTVHNLALAGDRAHNYAVLTATGTAVIIAGGPGGGGGTGGTEGAGAGGETGGSEEGAGGSEGTGAGGEGEGGNTGGMSGGEGGNTGGTETGASGAPSGGTDPSVPPVPTGAGNALAPVAGTGTSGAAAYVEIGEDGTPLGEWHYDDGQNAWIFDAYSPLGALPQTGALSAPGGADLPRGIAFPALPLLTLLLLCAGGIPLFGRRRERSED
jgi:hypothetical protein